MVGGPPPLIPVPCTPPHPVRIFTTRRGQRSAGGRVLTVLYRTVVTRNWQRASKQAACVISIPCDTNAYLFMVHPTEIAGSSPRCASARGPNILRTILNRHAADAAPIVLPKLRSTGRLRMHARTNSVLHDILCQRATGSAAH